MPQRLDFETLRRAAVDQIDRLVEGWGGTRAVEVPGGLRGRFDSGWRITVAFSSATLDLLLLIDSDFPFSLPRVAVDGGPDLLEWPHLERHGLLCSMPSLASVDFTRPGDVVHEVMASTCELIEQNLTDLPVGDFRDEFLSYWSYAIDEGARDGVSLVRPGAPSRAIRVWRGQNRWYFGESAPQLQTWLSHRYSTKPDKYDPKPAWLLWLPEPWTPSEYPSSPQELREAIGKHAKDLKAFDRLLADRRSLAVLAGSESEAGFSFGALSYRRPSGSRRGKGWSGARDATRGFRPGKVPGNIVRQRFFAHGGRLLRHRVERADPGWVHGRDQNPDLSLLQGEAVAVIGVGSLGSAVARLLLQSGADRIILVDSEDLEWANIGRHELGASSVGKPKSRELASTLHQRFPHASVESHVATLGAGQAALVDQVLSCRLAVLLTGSWTLQAYLNFRWLGQDVGPDLVLGWMEPHALAAHSVHLSLKPFRGCLRCGMDPMGRPNLEVIEWAVDQTREIPACGGTFMPYGPVDLSMAAALVVEHCIDVFHSRAESSSAHRVCMASKGRIETAGGAWSPHWVKSMGDPGKGGRTIARDWPRDPACPSCQGRS